MAPSVTELEVVRQRIVTAARAHFFAHGFRGVTMDDIARALGMSKKTVYAHFPSKPALLEASLLDKLRCLETELSRITSEHAADFATGLHELLACIQRHTEEISPPFLRDMQREGKLFRMIEERRRSLIQRHFGLLLQEGRREGLIRRDVSVRLILEIILAAVQAIMNPPRLAELGLTPRSGFAAILSVILHGVVTPQRRTRR